MKTRQTLLLGLAGLGFLPALPAQAALAGSIDFPVAASAMPSAPEYREGRFLVVKRDDGDNRYEPRRDQRDNPAPKGNKKHQTRDAERSSEPQNYGYGYERRQLQPLPHDDDHGRR